MAKKKTVKGNSNEQPKTKLSKPVNYLDRVKDEPTKHMWTSIPGVYRRLKKKP